MDIRFENMTGTTGHLDEYKTWNEIEGMLEPVPTEVSVINSSYAVGGLDSLVQPTGGSLELTTRKKQIRPVTSTHVNVTQIKVSANVSGLLIPNTKRIYARVIAVKAGEEIVDQDLKFVQWKKVSLRKEWL